MVRSTSTTGDNVNPDQRDPAEADQNDATSQKIERSSSDATQCNTEEEPQSRKLYLQFGSQLPSPDLRGLDVDPASLPAAPNLTLYQDPMTWSPARKAFTLFLSCISTFLTAYAAGSYSPPASLMAESINATRVTTLVGITTFCIGFAFAPMALAPVSEIWGRYPVFFGAGIVFVAFQGVCSVMPNLAGMLIARFFVGCGGSVFSSVMAGVLADLWTKEERNTPMALFSAAVLGGTSTGPLISTVFADLIDDKVLAWKWCFWHQTIMGTLLVASIIAFFRESRASVLLTRRARALNIWYDELERAGVHRLRFEDDFEEKPGEADMTEAVPEASQRSDIPERPARIRWVVMEDEQRASLQALVATSLRRPFYLLFTEPVVFWFSLWAAFAWGVLFLSFAVVPYLYGVDLSKSSWAYLAMIISTIVATAVGIYQEKLLRHPQWRRVDGFEYSDSKFWAFMRKHFPAESPEARLYFSCITALCLPAGIFGGFLGSGKQDDDSMISHAVGLGFAIWGVYVVYLATFNYLADSYNIYASSALAAQGFARNMMGGAFPVITGMMFDRLGVEGAGGLLGGVAMALSVTPWILVFFGERIRARSKVMKSLKQ
ncbi:major facilitator superfamily protein [Sarocladium implicatum]|nr:major facilitator superfamily protein [Sarocladium implicatum]